MATVKNTSGGELRLIRVGSEYHRRSSVNLILQDDETGVVPDDFTTDEGPAAMISGGDLEVLSYDPTDAVVAGEVTTVNAIYKIDLDNTPGDIAASNTASSEASDADTHDFSNPVDRDMVVTVNGVDIEHSFVPSDFVAIAAATAEEVDASLDANTELAAVVDISNDGSLVTIATKALGTSATLAFSGAAATLLGFATPAAGTEAPSSVEVLVKDGAGNPAPGVRVDVKIYDAVTAGALLADTPGQLASKGTLDADYVNDTFGTTDALGELDFEIASDISGADNLYLELTPPADYFLAVTTRKGSDSSRELIAKSS
jgi:hypothetical protein